MRKLISHVFTQDMTTWKHAADKNTNCVQHNKTHVDRRARSRANSRPRTHTMTENGARVSEPRQETETQDMSAGIRTPRVNTKQGTQTRESARLEHTWKQDMTGLSGLCHKTMNNTRPKWQNSDTTPPPPPQKGRHLGPLTRDTKNKTETWQHKNMTTQRLTHNNRPNKNNQETKRAGGREAKPVPAGKLSKFREGREGWASPGVLAGSQGGAGGMDQVGSGRTRTLEDGQGGAGGTDQAGFSPSGGQGGAGCFVGSQGGPSRTGSLGGAGRVRRLKGASRARRLRGAGRARRLGGSGMASGPAEGSGMASWPTANSWMSPRSCGTEGALLLLLLRRWERGGRMTASGGAAASSAAPWGTAGSSATTGKAAASSASTGAGSVGSWTGAGSGVDSVGSRTGTGSGAGSGTASLPTASSWMASSHLWGCSGLVDLYWGCSRSVNRHWRRCGIMGRHWRRCGFAGHH